MPGNIVDSLCIVTGCSEPIAIGFIVNLEFDGIKQLCVCRSIRSHVGKYFGKLHAEALDVAVINKGIVVVARAALPCQNDLIIITVIAADKACVRIDGSTVGHTQGVVGVTGVQNPVDIGGVAVDLGQAGACYIYRHVTVIIRVVDRELAGSGIPGSNLVGAGSVAEDINGNTGSLVIGQALTERIIKIVGGQGGRLGSNGRQGADKLILHHVTGRTGSGMGIAVSDGSGTIVLSGIGLAFSDRLLQTGNAGFIFGVHSDIIEPFLAAVMRCGIVIAVYRGHGQADEEGIHCAGNHFRHFGFYQEI